jgi:hypothetical protein
VGRRAKGVRLLVSGQAPKVETVGDTLSVIVPSILDHEVVAIDI